MTRRVYTLVVIIQKLDGHVGLAKIFEEKSAKPHGGNWVKKWLHTNFESSSSDFYHDTRAPKVQIL